jgi:hypothetical protein
MPADRTVRNVLEWAIRPLSISISRSTLLLLHGGGQVLLPPREGRGGSMHGSTLTLRNGEISRRARASLVLNKPLLPVAACNFRATPAKPIKSRSNKKSASCTKSLTEKRRGRRRTPAKERAASGRLEATMLVCLPILRERLENSCSGVDSGERPCTRVVSSE